MKKIWRNSIYYGKILFRDTSFTFWGLAYPIVLASFFFIAFSGITNVQLETINIGIEKGNPVHFILEDIELLNIVEISEEDVSKSLESEEIAGYIKEDLNLVVDRSGLNQTIVRSILDQIKQAIALDEQMGNLDFGVDYLMTRSQDANGLLVIFYSLIAMVSTYGVFPGIETAVMIQANLSNVGERINLTPIKKSTLLISGLIVGLLINLFSNILLILFLKYVFKMKLITKLLYSSLFILLGNIFGISLGIFIGSSNKRSQGFKTMFSIAVTLFLSFLSGLMSPDIKLAIDKNIPILGKINPISIVSNTLYRINMLGNAKDLSQGIILLGAYSLALMGVSYLFLRRNQYDSL